MNVQQIKSKVKDKNLHRNSRTKAKSPQSSITDCWIYPMKTFVKLTFNNSCAEARGHIHHRYSGQIHASNQCCP